MRTTLACLAVSSLLLTGCSTGMSDDASLRTTTPGSSRSTDVPVGTGGNTGAGVNAGEGTGGPMNGSMGPGGTGVGR